LGPDTGVFLWKGEGCRILLDRLAVVHADKKYATVYGIRKFITVFTKSFSEISHDKDFVHTYKPFYRPF
jgi:hypothetical protein